MLDGGATFESNWAAIRALGWRRLVRLQLASASIRMTVGASSFTLTPAS